MREQKRGSQNGDSDQARVGGPPKEQGWNCCPGPSFVVQGCL